MKPLLIAIPGGPGLSSKTISGLSSLKESFDLKFLDYMGLDGTKLSHTPTYKEILKDFESKILKFKRDVFLIGHSFGGILVADLANSKKINVKGVVCVSTPFQKKTFEIVSKQYIKFQTPELKEAALEWNKKKSDKALKSWLACYDGLYFSKEKISEGRNLLLSSPCSSKLFIGCRNAGEKISSRIRLLKGKKIKRLLIAGAQDNLLTAEALRKDAKASGFEFKLIKNGSHFVMMDKPIELAKYIEKFLLTKGDI